jgi:endonuclease/exonuclease/phosphatase family metal-dependent hydrolase
MQQKGAVADRPHYGCYAYRKHKKLNGLTVLFSVAVSISLATSTQESFRQNNIWVTKSGSPAPTGTQSAPYQMVEAGIARAKHLPGSNIIIGPGKYYETFTVNTPVTLKASGGVVTIGKLDYQTSTTMDIITLNTHLGGDETFMCNWADCLRAGDIGKFIKALFPKPDVVAFQEIWDEDFFKGGDCDEDIEILRDSKYKYGEHGEKEKPVLNSGLALMSKDSLRDFVQVQWNEEGGEWPTAKGYVHATIIKDKFAIGLFNLHAKAGDDLEDRIIRREQLQQLIDTVTRYRRKYPDRVVFVMGDFNIKGERSEYYNTLIERMKLVNGKDADRNSPGFVVHLSYRDQWTCDDSNLLA